MAKSTQYMTFADATKTWDVTKGRLSHLAKGYKSSSSKKRIKPKLVYGKDWVRKTMQIEASDRTLEMTVQVLTDSGIAFMDREFDRKDGSNKALRDQVKAERRKSQDEA
jgi:hypothetical protein